VRRLSRTGNERRSSSNAVASTKPVLGSLGAGEATSARAGRAKEEVMAAVAAVGTAAEASWGGVLVSAWVMFASVRAKYFRTAFCTGIEANATWLGTTNDSR
jgi:hypothetical protein